MYSEGSSTISRGSREESPSIATEGRQRESGPLLPGSSPREDRRLGGVLLTAVGQTERRKVEAHDIQEQEVWYEQWSEVVITRKIKGLRINHIRVAEPFSTTEREPDRSRLLSQKDPGGHMTLHEARQHVSTRRRSRSARSAGEGALSL